MRLTGPDDVARVACDGALNEDDPLKLDVAYTRTSRYRAPAVVPHVCILFLLGVQVCHILVVLCLCHRRLC